MKVSFIVSTFENSNSRKKTNKLSKAVEQRPLVVAKRYCIQAEPTPFVVHQVFYWSHLSYVWVWALLTIHCANFWKWFVVPGFVFLLEKIVGIAVSRMGGLHIVEVNLLPSKVRKADPLPRSGPRSLIAVCPRSGDPPGHQTAAVLPL